jgi:uncharacterized protein (DUF1778 family)
MYGMADDSPRSQRIEARIAPDALAVVKRAAEIQGRSVSDFVVAAAWDVAQRTIADAQVMRLSLEAQEAVAELLLDPPTPGPALQRAFDAHRELIREAE